MHQTKITIRKATVADAPILSPFMAKTFADTYGAQNDPHDLSAYLTTSYTIPNQTAELKDPNTIIQLVHHKNDLIAFSHVRRHPTPPACITADYAHPIEIFRFYVDKPYHGKGIARPLMETAINDARELGGQHIWLGVWEHNPRGKAFYKKEGFTAIGDHIFTVGSDDQTDIILIKKINAPT